MQKVAIAIQTINSISDTIPDRTRLLLLKTLVHRNIHYSAILLNSCSLELQNKLQRQINWVCRVKSFLHKNDSVCKYRKKNRMPTAMQIIAYRSITYFSALTTNSRKSIPTRVVLIYLTLILSLKINVIVLIKRLIWM